MTKGVKKREKGPKQSINRSWQLIFTIASRKSTKRWKDPFAKILDYRSFSGWNDLMLGLSKYKLLPLAIQFILYALLLGFEGEHCCKKSSLGCMRAIQGQPTYVLGQETTNPRIYETVYETTRVHLKRFGKNQMQVLNLLHFSMKHDVCSLEVEGAWRHWYFGQRGPYSHRRTKTMWAMEIFPVFVHEGTT
jgi:hypothetical protein